MLHKKPSLPMAIKKKAFVQFIASHKLKISFISYGLLTLSCILATGISITLYKHTQDLLRDRLIERLDAIASTATLQFDADVLNQIENEDSIGSDAYISVVNQLELIRNYNNDLKFAYLLRPTEDPNTYLFIADADSKDPNAEIDLNEDGVINEDDALIVPGEEYDISEIPALKNAIFAVTTDAEPVTDQWGTFMSAYAPIKDKGETVAILGIDVEITDYLNLIRKTFLPFSLFIIFLLLLLCILTNLLVRMWNVQVEAVKELDKQKDELLGIVSHQLATPVASMKWYLEMMTDGDVGELNKDQKEHVKTMTQISVNLSDLVSMILDVSRIQLGRIKVEKQELNLKEFFEEILSVIEPKAEQKNINFEKNIPKDFPMAELDKRYTRMTIENLLTNAVKYTPEKGKVSLNVKISNNEMYCIVKDTGVGIPKNDQKKIFGKLFRASNVKNSIDGNGFGLYVAKGAVEAQGGEIGFSSAEGKGTTFWIKLPLK